MTPHQAIAEYVPWLPGSAADKAASLGVHKSTLFAWIAESEGRAPAPREGRAGRKRHRDPTWVDVLKLARLLKEHGANVTAFGVTAERLARGKLETSPATLTFVSVRPDCGPPSRFEMLAVGRPAEE